MINIKLNNKVMIHLRSNNNSNNSNNNNNKIMTHSRLNHRYLHYHFQGCS